MKRSRHRLRWGLLVYPIVGIFLVELGFQLAASIQQANLLSQANLSFIGLAIVNQLAVYAVLTPSMRQFYAKAGIGLTNRFTFSLMATARALSRLLPFGEYFIWRASLNKQRGGVSATTQWMIMYYAGLLAALIALFALTEGLTLLFYPNAAAPTLVGQLRYLPVVFTVGFGVFALLFRFKPVRALTVRLIFNKLGSKSVWPTAIIRDLQLGWRELGSLSAGCVAVWILESMTLYLCLRSIGVAPPIVMVIFGYCFARLFSLIPLTPGGIGEMEAGTALFFGAYAYPLGGVFTATILYRLISYWPPMFVGIALYAWSARKDRIRKLRVLVSSRLHHPRQTYSLR